MSIDFYRTLEAEAPVNRVEIYQPDRNFSCDPAIRLHCWQSKLAWNLQVRGQRRNGKTSLIANASLRREDLEALRDACNEALME